MGAYQLDVVATSMDRCSTALVPSSGALDLAYMRLTHKESPLRLPSVRRHRGSNQCMALKFGHFSLQLRGHLAQSRIAPIVLKSTGPSSEGSSGPRLPRGHLPEHGTRCLRAWMMMTFQRTMSIWYGCQLIRRSMPSVPLSLATASYSPRQTEMPTPPQICSQSAERSCIAYRRTSVTSLRRRTPRLNTVHASSALSREKPMLTKCSALMSMANQCPLQL